ncbi:hypothetical protein [Flavobacterium gyeonganense]|uniref:hypothetical protein n=1 Tax=Flavobacterium gyeonganense TaxID=1310418 RepID=UPI0030FBB8F3
MYFTRNNFLNGKKGKDEKRITLLKLYKADFINDKWTNITELPFNSDQFSVAHPALSPDEKNYTLHPICREVLGSLICIVL